jgi:hypothetical protein
MASTYDDHADEAARLLDDAVDSHGNPVVAEPLDLMIIGAGMAAAQVHATLALAAAVRELVVTTTLPTEALDAIRQQITDPAGHDRTGYSRQRKRPPADRPAEDLTTPTQ